MQPAPFAILPRLNAVTRPVVFPDIGGLASHIHRERHGQGIELIEVEDLHHQWHAEGGGEGVDMPEGVADRGVAVWTLDLANNRDRMIGWAWLNGGGLERLREALRVADIEASAVKRSRGYIADSSALRAREARARVLGDHARVA